MTSPAMMRVALIGSLGVTGGGIYFYLSDGGDPKVAQEKMEDARQRVIQESEKLHIKGVEGLGQAKEVLENARVKVVETSRSILSKDEEKGLNPDPAVDQPKESPAMEPARSFCHTCSGPRIWFFAEKLRLKRRFTPYPDPPRD